MEQERRIRREIANSNERRRMQSINAGFQSLRALLPHHEGEKLSKAAILQQTTQYIYQMEQEKTSLLNQNCQLKRLVNQQNQDSDGGSSSDSPLPKRKRSDAESPDEMTNGSSVCHEETDDKYKKELIDLRIQLDNERRMRMVLEEQTRSLEAQLFPDRARENSHQIHHLQYKEFSQENCKDQSHHDRHTPSPLSSASLSPRRAVSPITITTTATIVAPIQHDRVPPINRPKVEGINENVDEDYTMVEDDDDENSRKSGRGYLTSHKRSPSPVRCLSPTTQVTATVPAVSLYPHSKQNLETIVEAIRHLEGDHLFSDEPVPKRCEVKKEPSPPLTFTATSDMAYHPTMQVTQAHQTRPGVIVSAHS
ncbi:Transcription factor AP-4 (Activating enhancer binding protein 4) [Chamberlinius hualienensis]